MIQEHLQIIIGWERTDIYNNGFPILTALTVDDLTVTQTLHLYNLYARNNIYIDLNSNTLTIPDDVNLSLAAGNDINTLSGGTIITNRTTTGGNIDFTTDNLISLTSITFNSNGGDITFTSDADGSGWWQYYAWWWV